MDKSTIISQVAAAQQKHKVAGVASVITWKRRRPSGTHSCGSSGSSVTKNSSATKKHSNIHYSQPVSLKKPQKIIYNNVVYTPEKHDLKKNNYKGQQRRNSNSGSCRRPRRHSITQEAGKGEINFQPNHQKHNKTKRRNSITLKNSNSNNKNNNRRRSSITQNNNDDIPPPPPPPSRPPRSPHSPHQLKKKYSKQPPSYGKSNNKSKATSKKDIIFEGSSPKQSNKKKQQQQRRNSNSFSKVNRCSSSTTGSTHILIQESSEKQQLYKVNNKKKNKGKRNNNKKGKQQRRRSSMTTEKEGNNEGLSLPQLKHPERRRCGSGGKKGTNKPTPMFPCKESRKGSMDTLSTAETESVSSFSQYSSFSSSSSSSSHDAEFTFSPQFYSRKTMANNMYNSLSDQRRAIIVMHNDDDEENIYNYDDGNVDDDDSIEIPSYDDDDMMKDESQSFCRLLSDMDCHDSFVIMENSEEDSSGDFHYKPTPKLTNRKSLSVTKKQNKKRYSSSLISSNTSGRGIDTDILEQ